MSAEPRLDGRRQQALRAELMRRAATVLGGDGRVLPVGAVATAILGVAARIGEEVTRRLDRVPEKQADNFYAAMGIGRDPALPARVPLMLKLANPAPAGLVAPSGTRLMASSDPAPVIFETETAIALVPGTIASLWAVDAAGDHIYQPPPGVIDGPLPRIAPVRRSLRGGAAAGASQLQIDPVAGLVAGTVLALGNGASAPQHRIVEVKDGVVTIAPALADTLPEDSPVAEVTSFAPYAGSRDRQSHGLYIGHATLLDVPSAVGIIVSGVALPAEAEWHWYGDLGDGPGWQAFGSVAVDGTRVTLNKPVGASAKTAVHGRETLWIRAQLPGASGDAVVAQDIRLAVAADGRCALPRTERCAEAGPSSIKFEAIAVTTPIVPNQPFYPFGREPRLYDSFYIGCAEALSKAGAEVNLCFQLGGPDLGPITVVSNNPQFQVFGVGTDGIPYRAAFRPDAPPRINPLPLPTGDAGGGPFEARALIAARLINGRVELAIASNGRVHRASLSYDSTLAASEVTWSLLQDTGATPVAPITRLYIGGESPPLVYALAGDTLWHWQTGNPQPEKHPEPVTDLIPVDDRDDAAALVYQADGKAILKRGARADFQLPGEFALPERERAGWLGFDADGTVQSLFVAGFDPVPGGDADEVALRLVELVRGVIANEIPQPEVLPIGFGAPARDNSGGSVPPTMLLARANPVRIALIGDTLFATEESASIGTSDNPYRRIVTRAGKTVVQKSDGGLLYRDDAASVAAIPIAGARKVALAADIPPGAVLLQYEHASFQLSGTGGRDQLLVPAETPARPLPDSGDQAIAFTLASGSGQLTRTATEITLSGQAATTPVDVLLRYIRSGVPEDAGVWHLVPVEPAGTGPGFEIPDDFPAIPPAADGFTYQLLTRIGPAAGASVRLREVVAPVESNPFAGLTPPFFTLGSPAIRVSGTLESFGAMTVFAFPHAAVEGATAPVASAPPAWSTLGPALPANPALSWEYWNGQSWWGLESAKLVDGTANLLVNGGVSFVVPPDIRETDVGGRSNYWIRARLVGGDYGQARVTVTTTPAGSAAGTATNQTIDRDLSAIRSPYLTVLTIRYCASTLVLPEIVLTEDSLGVTDQTSANRAGLPIEAFVPVSALINRPPIPTAPIYAPAETCDDPCPPKTPPAVPSPCDAPGAYDSCDSPCVASEQSSASSARGAAVPEGIARALMVGFDMPPVGDPVALYADVAPGQPATRLAAAILRGGRFEEIAVLEDASHGLSEPGRIVMSMPAPPDLAPLFGVPAYWLLLHPVSASAGWSPKVAGLYLNAVTALSAETRLVESLGTSSGVPNQRFRLTGTPVMPDSLQLRVRESIPEEDTATLQPLPQIAGMPGPWVPWHEVENFTGSAPDRRVYILDPEAGTLVFGDGIEGAIPPLGAELLAATYKHVVGAAGNAVLPGAELQLLSPIAGVEKVVALSLAAGGSDVEVPLSARARGAAKLAHGDRVFTPADIEDFAVSRFPVIAQAKAVRTTGSIRLVVVLRGAEPRPVPSFLRELEDRLGDVAGFGLARPGGFTAIGPRLLSVRIGIVLLPDNPAAFGDIALVVRAVLTRLFDTAEGGLEGHGWPLGLLPRADDIAAALDPVLGERALLGAVTLVRAGDRDGEPLPESLPADVLIRLDPADIILNRDPGATA